MGQTHIQIIAINLQIGANALAPLIIINADENFILLLLYFCTADDNRVLFSIVEMVVILYCNELNRVIKW